MRSTVGLIILLAILAVVVVVAGLIVLRLYLARRDKLREIGGSRWQSHFAEGHDLTEVFVQQITPSGRLIGNRQLVDAFRASELASADYDARLAESMGQADNRAVVLNAAGRKERFKFRG